MMSAEVAPGATKTSARCPRGSGSAAWSATPPSDTSSSVISICEDSLALVNQPADTYYVWVDGDSLPDTVGDFSLTVTAL